MNNSVYNPQVKRVLSRKQYLELKEDVGDNTEKKLDVTNNRHGGRFSEERYDGHKFDEFKTDSVSKILAHASKFLNYQQPKSLNNDFFCITVKKDEQASDDADSDISKYSLNLNWKDKSLNPFDKLFYCPVLKKSV